jgi:pimeloyl-ACP methyl ester carboxylesterase/DNA-binding CsgD family transcriptional regulator
MRGRPSRRHGSPVPDGADFALRSRDNRPDFSKKRSPVEKRPRQRIHYLRTADGVQLAWADASAGPLLVKAANWLTHLEYEWESPVWGHWLRFFSSHFRLVRYDERGCGMSDWNVGDLSPDRWIEDLEAVVAAAAPQGPFTLLGISHGAVAAVSFAARYPERVSHLLLYGAYARGWSRRGDLDAIRTYQAITDLIRFGWGKDNPAFRQVFTSRFIPGATDEQMNWFNELCRKTTSPKIAAELMEARGKAEVVDELERVRTPTLVAHARNDQVVPLAEGRLIASAIPGAEFVELDSSNHILLESEPAWERFRSAALEFTGLGRPVGEDPIFRRLTAREREVLTLLTEGLGNADIAERLALSEKTVRNHLSNLFDKLGVWTRAQAIVFARDRGFGTS